MARVHSFDELVRTLEQLKVPHRASVANREIELDGHTVLPGSLHVRWASKVPFVTLHHVLIEDVPADRLSELETAVIRVNHLLDVPGFGLDLIRRRLYYRLAVPAIDGIDPDTLNRLCKGVLANALEFLSSFQTVASGRRGAEIAEIYKDLAHERATRFEGSS